MRHYYLSPDTGNHYAVGRNHKGVLVQIGEDRHGGHEQVRLVLTPEQARHLAALLIEHGGHKSLSRRLSEDQLEWLINAIREA